MSGDAAVAARPLFVKKRAVSDSLRHQLGASAIVAKRMYRRHPGLDLLALTSWQMLYAAVIMSAVALLVPQQPVDWHPAVFGALAYSAILATALAWSLWLYVLRNLPAGIASLSTLAVPVFGVLFSWWLLGKSRTDWKLSALY